MVSYHDLANTNLVALDTAATGFEQMVRKWEYNSSFQSGVFHALQASGWSGEGADAAAARLTTARTQIDDAFNETAALAKALRDAHDQLLQCQKTLHAIQQDAAAEGLTISADGATISWAAALPTTDPNAIAEHEKEMQGKADAIAARIKSVLQQATEIDEAAAAALAGDTGTSSTSFNAKPVGGLSEEEAQQAANLARQSSNLTDAQVTQLDALLKAHANDSRFATAFYNDLGPGETLKFWGQLSEGSTGAVQPDQKRLAILKDLQVQLGTSLACATNTQNWPRLSDAWEAGLRKAGAEKIQLTNGPDQPAYQPYGYQILGSILRTGNYDPHFLNPIAEHITQLTEKDPQLWISNSPMLPGVDIKTNFLGNGSGFNPMTGVLEALGHSPAAATNFFHNPATLYNADGTSTGHTASNGYLNFLTDTSKNPQYPDAALTDMHVRSASVSSESTALGHALEAATTGVAWDAPRGTPVPPHTAAEAQVFSQVVEKFSANPDLIHGEGAPFTTMNSSLGHMTASYIGDVDLALAGKGAAPFFSAFGAQASLNQSHLRIFLNALGRNPDAYGAISQAQNAYTAAQLHSVVSTHLHDPDLDGAVRNVAQQGNYVTGLINYARANEVFGEHAASDAAYNAAIDRNADFANVAWKMAFGDRVGEIPVVGDVAKDKVGELIKNIADSYKIDTTQQAITSASDLDTAAKTAAQNAAVAAVQSALHGSSGLSSQTKQDLIDAANNSATVGYTSGSDDDHRITQGH